MRESHIFAQRTPVRQSKEVNVKCFLVFEGKCTEPAYFEALNSKRHEHGISPLIELVQVVRSYSEEGWSNPQKLLDRMLQNLRESEEGKICYNTLVDWILDYYIETCDTKVSQIELNSIRQRLEVILVA